MRLDKYSNPIFNEQDLFDAIYQGQKIVPELFVESSEDIISLENQISVKFFKPLDDYDISLEEFDKALQCDWQMPDDYKNLDIENWLYQQCPPWDPESSRLTEELQEFKARNMLDLLRWLKYFVDTCRSKNLLWGVGRGSSVASYVLFLIGVHRIDCIKYNLDWREFLR